MGKIINLITMFKFAAIAVIATAVVAQEEIEDAIKELITMENCEYKTAEQIEAEAEDEASAAACNEACTPEELAGLSVEEQEELAAEFTEEQTAAVVSCAMNCSFCANFGAAVEESASAIAMGATVAFAAAALF